ncbi:hypothetical protein Ancab_025542 [Ancistrocladus abbreviatus]
MLQENLPGLKGLRNHRLTSCSMLGYEPPSTHSLLTKAITPAKSPDSRMCVRKEGSAFGPCLFANNIDAGNNSNNS